jgi:hypothetical protein
MKEKWLEAFSVLQKVYDYANHTILLTKLEFFLSNRNNP